MNKDQLILEDMYMQMYDEGLNWKQKLGIGAAGLGLAVGGLNGVGSHIVNKDNAHKSYQKETGIDLQNDELADAFKDLGHVQKVLQSYYNSKGDGTQVSVDADGVTFAGKGKVSKLPLKKLIYIVDTARSAKKVDGFSGYLAQHL